jgi:hypothetical protein
MLIHAKLKHGIGAAVIFNEVTIYHEDDDKGYSQSFDCEMVASRLSEATKQPVTVIDLTVEEAGGDKWNFDNVRDVAIAKYKAGLFIQIPVDLKAERAPLTEVLQWSASWDATQQAAVACKARGLTASQGFGVAFGIYVNGVAANMKNKDHKEIVTSVTNDVARRMKFLK